MSALKGDFIGFTFNNVHSSSLNIIRTSDGSRFVENLLPVFSDKTQAIPGGDGTYFFGANYTQRVFDIPIAFDSLTETNLIQLKRLLGDKQLHDLIFDEYPYKVYRAKVSGNPSIKYICFEEEGERVYKGEGTISLVAYYPFARSRYKYKSQYNKTNIPEWDDNEGNLDEWIESSGIKDQGGYDILQNQRYNLWNPGDLETDYLLKFNFDENNMIASTHIFIDGTTDKQIQFNDITKIGSDYGIQLNTANNLLEGINEEGLLTGNVYNKFMDSGYFFKIPMGESSMTVTGAEPTEIKYDFLYF